MDSDKIFAQMVTVAALFRAVELLNGKQFTREQVGLYITNYTGKYSRKTIEAGVGLVVAPRLKPPTLIERLFGKKPKLSELEKKIEHKAKQILEMPGARVELGAILDKISGDS